MLGDPKAAVSVDDVVDVVYDVALDPKRYEELCGTWEVALWPQIQERGNVNLENRVFSHFIRAEEILDRLDADASNADLPEIARLIDNVSSTAALAFDRNLQIAAINHEGTNLLQIEAGSEISKLPILTDDLDAFAKYVRKILKYSDATETIVRTRRQHSENLMVFHLRLLCTQSGDRYVVAITSDIHWRKSYEDTLRNAFSLSPTEADIVRMIVDCKSLNDIAKMRGRSVGTVRNQIKSIFSKTGTRSQTELVRIVMSVMEISTNYDQSGSKDLKETSPRFTVPDKKLLPAEQRFVIGPDQRKLEYLILGDPEGAPVFYLQTELGLSRMPRFIELEARRRELRVISPIRAGYGQSDPVPQGKKFIIQVAQDLLTVMDHEGISSIPVISMAADNAFPAQMHILRPGSVSAIIATSGCFPFLDDDQAARQKGMHRLMHSTARYFPRLLPFVAKAGFKAVLKLGKKRFVEKMFAESPADLAIFKDPEVETAVLLGSDVALSESHSAHEAFILQCLSYHEPEQLLLFPSVENEVPYHTMNGLKDPSVHADTLAESKIHYPWVDFHIYPDAGQWLFFQYPNDVFDLVERYIVRAEEIHLRCSQPVEETKPSAQST
ncbi:MAG: LuxR C-terminal-related transcriptional regulator [Pseudomonadota bacterium]